MLITVWNVSWGKRSVDVCGLYHSDKRSLEFTDTRSFIKLFRTGSATVVNEYQILFHFLSIANQLCQMFIEKDELNLRKIF